MCSVFCNMISQLFLILFLITVAESLRTTHGSCSSHHFSCGNGRCIPIAWACDMEDDCGDDTDEENCDSRTCSSSEYKCHNDKCIPLRWLCDNENDCGDRSDEDQCENKTCSPDQFHCGLGSAMCIPITWRCDGQEDCNDGSDEKDNCRQITCTEEEFTCDNNKCITRRWLCDQDNDCGDMSDEVSCPNVTCAKNEFMCLNGKCVPDRWRCDGDVDCLDGSDENACPTIIVKTPCNDKEFMCNSRDCIHASWVCDGDADCPDRSDEANCTVNCGSDQFQCSNKKCIARTQQCNGITDCTDGSDEESCSTLEPQECDPKTQYNCGGKKCIPIELVCNHQNDCGYWEDEPSNKCFMNECALNNGGCSQKCIDDTIGYHCDCNTGYQLIDDYVCKDIDECQIPGSCSQLCNNTKGSFKCSCLNGYSIEPSNHHRCKAQLGHGALLFANRRDLRKIDLETSEYTLVASSLRSAVAIDYDYQENLVVWTDVLEESIYSSNLDNGAAKKTIVNEKIITPDGIAMDWIHNNIYWTDTGRDSISVTSMDGKLIKLLFGTNLDEPRAIVVNPFEGWMFWADWGELAKIERAGMDGTHRSIIVSKDIRWPNGLAIDYVTRKIFWADAKFHTLCSSDYDGMNVKVTLTSTTKVKHPFALDVFEDWLYWSDWESESIYKADKFSGRNVQTVASDVYSPMGVRVYHSYKQPNGSNFCKQRNGGCSHMCLPAPQLVPESANFTCVCPDGMMLTDNKQTCISIDAIKVKPTISTSTYTTTRRTTYSTTKRTTYATTTRNPRTRFPDRYRYSTYKPHYTTYTRRTYTTDPSTTISSTEAVVTMVSALQTPSQTVQQSILMNETLREIQEEIDDSGRIAGIIIGVLGGFTIVLSLVGFFVYKQYLRRNITSMNFDNPVYRKTTEDQFSLEKNQYQPARSYPSSLEPLTSPGTNEFV